MNFEKGENFKLPFESIPEFEWQMRHKGFESVFDDMVELADELRSSLSEYFVSKFE